MMAFHVSTYSLIVSYVIECTFFGMNCVLFAFCAYTLWGQKSTASKVLLFVTTLQFLICVTQLIFNTSRSFVVFTALTGQAAHFFSTVNVYILGPVVAFFVNVYVLVGILAIWRLYVLYDNNIWISIPAILLWIALVCDGIFLIIHFAKTPPVHRTFNVIELGGWVFLSAFNLFVAVAICIRLCIAQRRMHTGLSASLYKSIAIILVDCGILITVCSLGMLTAYIVSLYATTGPTTEIAIASQLLATARHAMLNQGRDTQTATMSEVMPLPRRQSSYGESSAGLVKTTPVGEQTAMDATPEETPPPLHRKESESPA